MLNRCLVLLPKQTGARSCSRPFWTRKEEPAFSLVFPQKVSPQLDPATLPASVVPPSYYITGDPGPGQNYIDIKNEESIECMRRSCSLAKSILDQCEKIISPGTTTEDIDKLVTQLSFDNGAYPSPLNYRNFPKSVCTSVNNCVCHGIPDSRELKIGDIINVDITVFLNGHHGDCSSTFKVGEVDDIAEKLLNVTKESLYVGIKQCGPERPFSGIGHAIEAYVKKNGFKVIPAFTGHGIGTYFHGPPDIYPCRNYYPGLMKPGMTFTVEPAVSEGSPAIQILEDGWTAITNDGSRSAQFEHTILITETGYDILTS